ncbi:MAG: hypothetical protein GF346_11520 [Candidatus Eisenbacteria bacterium]|nr:hypothetical protein [Candidatus Latescibacterota bacterium]MBD3303065.1 hypothetical protein [Candidatus Eisenbacteria bacterium]
MYSDPTPGGRRVCAVRRWRSPSHGKECSSVSTTSSLGRPQRQSVQAGGNGGSERPVAADAAHSLEPQARTDRAGTTSSGRRRTDPEARALQVPIEPDHGFYLRFGKRLIDLVVGLAATIGLSPILLACAIAIKLDTPGPVLYCSTRVGRGGKTFRFYKLRSMIQGAEHHQNKLAHLNEVSGPVFKIARDPRITRVGRFLRKTSLDELPQLFNVLKGEMSLVGPRPPIPQEVSQYEPWQLRRLSIRPGITCLWQISGRSRLGFDEWMRLDMEYIDRRSLGLDLKILALTIPAVFSGEGAY